MNQIRLAINCYLLLIGLITAVIYLGCKAVALICDLVADKCARDFEELEKRFND